MERTTTRTMMVVTMMRVMMPTICKANHVKLMRVIIASVMSLRAPLLCHHPHHHHMFTLPSNTHTSISHSPHPFNPAWPRKCPARPWCLSLVRHWLGTAGPQLGLIVSFCVVVAVMLIVMITTGACVLVIMSKQAWWGKLVGVEYYGATICN